MLTREKGTLQHTAFEEPACENDGSAGIALLRSPYKTPGQSGDSKRSGGLMTVVALTNVTTFLGLDLFNIQSTLANPSDTYLRIAVTVDVVLLALLAGAYHSDKSSPTTRLSHRAPFCVRASLIMFVVENTGTTVAAAYDSYTDSNNQVTGLRNGFGFLWWSFLIIIAVLVNVISVLAFDLFHLQSALGLSGSQNDFLALLAIVVNLSLASISGFVRFPESSRANAPALLRAVYFVLVLLNTGLVWRCEGALSVDVSLARSFEHCQT
ncbi:hypothetical protein RQP46_011111 [Phenoliferia psychrophenolica]